MATRMGSEPTRAKHNGHRFLRMPFGLASAASVFQKLIENLFLDLVGVQAFQDDILVYAKTIEQYNIILDKVLGILGNKGMTVSKDKCKFMVTEIDYLGHKITSNGIFPKDDLVNALEKASKPHDKDSLRSFLGLGEYYARFVKGYAVVVEPLRQLLKKGCKFVWKEIHDEAFNGVKKKMIASTPGLETFDPEGKSFITVDASAIGLGAVFTQIVGGKERVITFISRAIRGGRKALWYDRKRSTGVCVGGGKA